MEKNRVQQLKCLTDIIKKEESSKMKFQFDQNSLKGTKINEKTSNNFFDTKSESEEEKSITNFPTRDSLGKKKNTKFDQAFLNPSELVLGGQSLLKAKKDKPLQKSEKEFQTGIQKGNQVGVNFDTLNHSTKVLDLKIAESQISNRKKLLELSKWENSNSELIENLKPYISNQFSSKKIQL